MINNLSGQPRSRTPFIYRKATQVVLPWAVIIVIFLLWEVLVWFFDVPEFILPGPIAIAQASWEFRAILLENSLQTLYVTFLGFGLAIVVGLLGGIAVGSSPIIYRGFYPALIGFNSIPKVAVVPIFVIWFGVGAVPAILTAFLISFFPILVNVATGLATVEPELKDVLRALGASRFQMLTKVGLPRAMPYFFASLKIAMTIAFVGAIVAETIAGDSGIGHLMLVAASRFMVPLAFAGLVVTGVMGVGMYLVANAVEKRMTGWSTRGSADEMMIGQG